MTGIKNMNNHVAKLTFKILTLLSFAYGTNVHAENLQLDATLFESSELMQSGRVSDALALLKGVESEYSDSREYLNNLAVAYLGNSQPEEALSIFRQLVDNDPLYSIITHNLLEMELQISETRPENIKPVLFVQTVDSFFTGEITQTQSPVTQRSELSASSSLNSEAINNTNLVNNNDTSRPRPTVSAQQQIQHGIIAKAAISNWTSSWSKKDYANYMRTYSSEFTGPKGENYQKWSEARKWALSKPGAISIDVNNLTTESITPDRITVVFDQRYNSQNYSDEVQKEITLIRENADWKILKEITLQTY